MLSNHYKKMDLEKTIQHYFGKIPDKPFLLGFSGGEDSLALAQCLIRLKIPFQIAHFDHAWRKESQQETEMLKNWAVERNIPFQTMRADKPSLKEDGARELRYAFFEKLFEQESYEALLLAHHQDDQIETIIKRVFEGAHLSKLRGIRGVSYRGNMPIWRPFLEVPKEVIRAYIRTHQLKPIDDPTNRDRRYLRARMRAELLPHLKEQLGKEVTSSILRLGSYSSELEDYLERQTEKIQAVEGPFGKFWDFTAAHPAEVRHLLKKLGASKRVLDQVIQALADRRANYLIEFGGGELVVDRGLVFHLKPARSFNYAVTFGPVVVGPAQDWRSWWQGKISVNIPEGDWDFGPVCPKFRKIQQQSQVPAFLRDTLPALVLEGKVVGEFLSGKNRYPLVSQSVTFEVNEKL